LAITLGSNIASLRGQRQLSRTSEELGTVFQRLSSGQRINKASDDAAGLSIADSLNAQSRIFNQGVRNLNDGQSLLSIADSAIENLSGIMIRLEELTEQSANGVYTNKQRKAMDDEAQALSKEFFRISKTTEFNGQKLLSGEFHSVNLQAGVGQNAVLSAGVGGAIGTGTLSSGLVFGSGAGTQQLTSGDFNVDGLRDLAVTNSVGTVSVLLGQNGGSFSTAVSYSTTAQTYGVATGDLNGDGILDLVTSHYTGQAVINILTGRGDGTFSAAKSIAVGSECFDVTVADLNADGLDDLAVAVMGNDTISVHLNTGNGSFAAGVSYAVTQPRSVVAGDLNGDSILDLVTAGFGTQAISVFIGRGDGTYQARVDYLGGGTVEDVLVGDFNNDGKNDVAAAIRSAGMASILLGNGNGTLAAAVQYQVGTEPLSISSGDINGDGNIDLATANVTSNNVSVLLGVGNGTFVAQQTLSAGTSTRAVEFGDFSGDGVTDLIGSSYVDASVRLYVAQTMDGVAPLQPFSLKTMADARQALPVFQRKREQLAAQRGEIGAFQSRTAIAINVLQVSSENFEAAESRIRDADIAEESSRLVRLNILQQAASSVLAQANQQPALALQLLGRT